MVEHQSIDALRERARKLNLKHWAIYRDSVRGRKFHNATNEDYLVEHFNSPYWLNRGVASVAGPFRKDCDDTDEAFKVWLTTVNDQIFAISGATLEGLRMSNSVTFRLFDIGMSPLEAAQYLLQVTGYFRMFCL